MLNPRFEKWPNKLGVSEADFLDATHAVSAYLEDHSELLEVDEQEVRNLHSIMQRLDVWQAVQRVLALN